MSAAFETLQSEVLSLSKPDRARLLDRLIASLDEDAASEKAWDELAASRDEALDAGTVMPVSLDEVMGLVRRSLSR